MSSRFRSPFRSAFSPRSFQPKAPARRGGKSLWLLAGVVIAGAALLGLFLPKGGGNDTNGKRSAKAVEKRFAYQPSQIAPVGPGKVVAHPKLPAQMVSDQLLVTLKPGVLEEQFREAVAALPMPVRVIGRLPVVNTLQVEVPAPRLLAARQLIARLPRVAGVSFNLIHTPTRTFNDPALRPGMWQGWALQRINAPQAWDLTTGTAVIAIVDSGSLVEHEELTGGIVAPYSYATNSAQMQEREFVNGGRRDFVLGHGTHVAVTAAGTANNGRGTAGVSPGSPVMPIQVIFYSEEVNDIIGTTAHIVDGIARAIANGAHVVNLSLGCGCGWQGSPWYREYQQAGPQRRREIEEAVLPEIEQELEAYQEVLALAERHWVILVKAAGNANLPALFDPLSYSRRVISVAATTPQDGRADFSNFGEYTTVSAPGTNIFSGFSAPGQPYTVMAGTSMAAPHVTGVVALMKSLKPGLTFEEVRDILVATGRRLNTDRRIGPLVNARAALDEVLRR